MNLNEPIKIILKNIFTLIILNAVNFSSSFIIAIMVSRMIGVTALGLFSFVLAVSAIVYLISDFGLTTLLIRKISEDKAKVLPVIKQFNTIKLLLASVCTVITIIIFISSDFILVLLAAVLAVIPRALQATYEGSLRLWNFQKPVTIIRSISSLLQILFSYLIILKGGTLTEVFFAILLMEIITAAVLFLTNKIKVLKNYPAISRKMEIFPVIRESSLFFVNNFLRVSVFQLNTIILKYMTNLNSVAILSTGTRFTNGFGLVSGAIYNSFYPYINNLRNDLKTAYNVTLKLIFTAGISGIIVSVLIYLFSDFLINISFKIEEGKGVLKILSFTVAPMFIYTITSSFLMAVYKEKFLFKVFFITTVLNVILNIVLIYYYDFKGSAFAILGSEIFLMLILLLKFYTEYKTFNRTN